jgi:hypothetical protein
MPNLSLATSIDSTVTRVHQHGETLPDPRLVEQVEEQQALTQRRGRPLTSEQSDGDLSIQKGELLNYTSTSSACAQYPTTRACQHRGPHTQDAPLAAEDDHAGGPPPTPFDEGYETDAGITYVSNYRAERPRAILVATHGAATTIRSPDLQLLCRLLLRNHVSVALITQPARFRFDVAARNRESDRAWHQVVNYARRDHDRVIVGGRSAGSRVAIRNASSVGAIGAILMSYPLVSARSAQELYDATTPRLVFQGELDDESPPQGFRPARNMSVTPVPGMGHLMDSPRACSSLQRELSAIVPPWLNEVLVQPKSP